MTEGRPADPANDGGSAFDETRTLEVFRNRPFLLLWLSQAATQIGGNMVIYGLTVIILTATRSNTAVSALILTFLGPAVLFSALAGVYVDRFDRRTILVVTNLLRAGAFVLTFLAGDHVGVILLLNVFISTVTVFFAPAEAAMIPVLVPRQQLLAANGIFTFTLNAAFALGFALFGPIVVTIAGAPALLLLVAALYLVAAGFCWTLPASPARPVADGLDPRQAVADAEEAVGSVLAQLKEGLAFIRSNRQIAWSLFYLGIAASLVGVMGVLGPDFATDTLGLTEKDFVVVVLPLGFGIIMGVLLLNSFGRYVPRRRLIEIGLVALGVFLAALSVAGPISQFLSRADAAAGVVDLSAITSLLAVVVAIALVTGIAYATVAIPAQTQLQEDLPSDVRGRVFGILNMLVSVSSFLPIIAVGPISDLIGTTAVILVVAIFVGLSGVASILSRGPLRPAEATAFSSGDLASPMDPVGAAIHHELSRERAARPAPPAPEPSQQLATPWIEDDPESFWADRAAEDEPTLDAARPGDAVDDESGSLRTPPGPPAGEPHR